MTAAPSADALLLEVADYVLEPGRADTPSAREAARLVLRDSVACLVLGAAQPLARALLLGDAPAGGFPVPATAARTGSVAGAVATSGLVRWLDFNDAWLAREWGHPSDNLGGVLAAAHRREQAGQATSVGDLLVAMVQAHEVQGGLAQGTALNLVGVDHVVFVKVATAAVAARLLGLSHAGVISAVSNAFADGGPLRAYRHAPDTGPRKSWAAGDASGRGLQLALLAERGEPGSPHVLSTPMWGFQDAVLRGAPVELVAPLGTTVIEHTLLKPRYPAEYHGQSAIEAAVALSGQLAEGDLDRVARIDVATTEPGVRIIDKSGPLAGFADRDHCLQYMVAVALLDGDVVIGSYGDERAADPRVDELRARTAVVEDEAYTRAYRDPADRAVPNRVAVTLDDGRVLGPVEVRYPLGHPRRRGEAEPMVEDKLRRALDQGYPAAQAARISAFLADPALDDQPLSALLEVLHAGDGRG